MSDADQLKELDALLARLEREERDLSERRRKLHDRMALFPNADRDQDLKAQEAELSNERSELHRRIDEVRAQRNELRGGPRKSVD